MSEDGGVRSTPLTMKMMHASKRGHSVTDRAVNSRLIGLFADPKIYAGAIGCFYLIFDTLEREMERAAPSDPRLAQFVASARPMFRADAFREDLVFFFGPAWERELQQRSNSPALQRYLDHLSTLSHANPLLLAAHSYTQHSAVASGGQIISKLVRKGLGLGPLPGPGTAAFTYAPGADPKALKAALKETLDALEAEMSASEVAEAIAEHQGAFGFNEAIIRGYKVGPLAPMVALVKLGARSRAVVAVVAVLALAVAARLWR